MKRWTMIILGLLGTGVLFLGCTGTQEETKIRCPKCGAYFGSEQGAESFRYTISPPSP
jgi:hypothetical protein